MDTGTAAAVRLRITEIFASVQGESSRVGLPTVFVRLTGCPLRCTWCDTAYAFTGGSTRALDDILAELSLYKQLNLLHDVEPRYWAIAVDSFKQ